jgi:hypothetical protein
VLEAPAPERQQQTHAASPSPPPWRAIAIGALLIPFGVLFGAYGYLIVQAIIWAQTCLQLGSVFTLLVVVALTRLLALLGRRFGLTQQEQLIVYVMVSLSACVSGVSMVPFLVNTMVAGRYYATPDNNWDRLVERLPRWFGPTDPEIVRDFYEASGSLYRWQTLSEWLLPLCYWSAIICLFVLGSLLLVNLFGEQWVRRERLTFPLVQLPIAMTGAGAFWRNRLAWLGMALAGVLESINFVNYLWPSVPTVWLKARRIPAVEAAAPPWNGLQLFAIAFFPFMIGVGFLLTLEASLSCWLFYLLGKAANIACIAAGFRGGTEGWARLPFLQEQGSGAMLGLVAAAIWVARRPLWEALKRAAPAGQTDLVSPRPSLIGFGLVVVALVVMSATAGLRVGIAAALFVLYFAFALAIARVVAETGAGWTIIGRNYPHDLVISALGTRAFSGRGLAVFAFTDWFDRDFRDTPATHVLAALKMRRETGIRARQLLSGMLVALVVGLISSLWAHLHIYYTYGAATAKVRGWYTAVGQDPYLRLANWVSYPLQPDWYGLGASAFGAVAAVLLGIARQRFPGLPLHPIGYAIANTPSMDYLWMPFLIAWLLKLLVLRYGGIKLYHKLVPLALGVILGDLAVPALWGIYGTIVSRRMYMFFPH